MKWTILNVSIPVHDLKKSKAFYEMLLGKNEESNELYQSIFSDEENVFFGNKGFGLRLYKPVPDLNISKHIQSRRSFVSILVDNMDNIRLNLDKNKIKHIYKDTTIKTILVQEPSLNVVQFVENVNGFDDEVNGWNMGLSWGIHHMNLESMDVRGSINFFCNLVGMIEGKWLAPVKKGDFSIDPSELAILPLSNNNRGLHIIKPDEGFGWRNNFAHNPSIGGHPAFTIKNISNLKVKLDKQNILYSDAKVYAMPGFHQIYLYDIDANMLEVNQAV
tara:strand:+ start:1215 stop:2039 length:825 start_codon:yes stop_codon:yes gene_type:complete